MSTAILNTTETAPAGPRPSPLRRWLRELLVHFLLIGLVLFALYRMFNPAGVEQENRSRIELTDDDLRQLELGWMAQWQRPPTPDEMRRLVEGKVRRGDPLPRGAGARPGPGRHHRQAPHGAEDGVSRRGCSAVREPNREELKAWFEKNGSASRLRAGRRFATSTSRSTRGVSVRARRPIVRLRSSPASRRIRLTRRLWPIRSCSRTTTAIARRSRWPLCSGRSSPGHCSNSSRARGRGPSNPGSAGIWSGSSR